MARPKRDGNCPYCAAQNYDPTVSILRRPGQVVMKCRDCDQFSIRMKSTQYPLDDPLDPEAEPHTGAPDTDAE
jgi:hypothetical protein